MDGIGSGHARVQAGALAATTDFSGGLVLADDLPDGLVIADHAGRVAVFNRAAARLTGISARIVPAALLNDAGIVGAAMATASTAVPDTSGAAGIH